MTRAAATTPRAKTTPARRGRPSKDQKAGETREAILDAAEDLFSKHGFYGVTIREVAREAGVDTALVAQTNANPTFGGETMARYFDPAIRRLIEVVRLVLPEAKDEDLYWGWHNLSGALTLTLGETGRLDLLSNGLCRSGDLETARTYMVRFAAAGFRAVCSR